MSEIELTTEENIVLQCAREADKSDRRCGRIDADAVVIHASTNGFDFSKNKATKILSRLCTRGVLRREPRASRGWGQGWFASTYILASKEDGRS